MIVRPCTNPGEAGYWDVELGPLAVHEVHDLIRYMRANGWEIIDDYLPAEFRTEKT